MRNIWNGRGGSYDATSPGEIKKEQKNEEKKNRKKRKQRTEMKDQTDDRWRIVSPTEEEDYAQQSSELLPNGDH